MTRTLDADDVGHHVPWLKMMNRAGNDIYIRPTGSQGVVLVDDLKPAAVEQMRRDGLQPCTVVETSPGNYQAWVRLSPTPIPPAEATAAARELARRYGGDPASADYHHFGRLAGFTNRKPEHTRPDGLSPYTRLVEAVQRVADRGRDLLAQVREMMTRAAERIAPRTAQNAPRASNAAEEYRRELTTLKNRYGTNLDLSRADYMIVQSLAKKGYTPEEARRALLEVSPDLERRKGNHAEDYAGATVARAFGGVQREAEKADGGMEM